jgi:hypothetical protein
MLGPPKPRHLDQPITVSLEDLIPASNFYRAECTESHRGRILHRSLYAEYLNKVRGYHTTEAYKKAMRKRQV